LAKTIAAYLDTKKRPNEVDEFTATSLAGDKWALDVFVAGGTISFSPATGGTPTVYNISAALAGTEYNQVLNANTKRFLIKLRDSGSGAITRVAYAAGETTTGPYVTFPSNATYEEQGLDSTGLTIYIQTDLAAQVVEIVEWV